MWTIFDGPKSTFKQLKSNPHDPNELTNNFFSSKMTSHLNLIRAWHRWQEPAISVKEEHYPKVEWLLLHVSICVGLLLEMVCSCVSWLVRLRQPPPPVYIICLCTLFQRGRVGGEKLSSEKFFSCEKSLLLHLSCSGMFYSVKGAWCVVFACSSCKQWGGFNCLHC